VPDVEAALARAESLGGTRVMGPVELDADRRLGQFRDPEGNVVGLIGGA
jgi:predicted enzyme related to lactoylglutathione lyase